MGQRSAAEALLGSWLRVKSVPGVLRDSVLMPDASDWRGGGGGGAGGSGGAGGGGGGDGLGGERTHHGGAGEGGNGDGGGGEGGGISVQQWEPRHPMVARMPCQLLLALQAAPLSTSEKK